MARRSTKAARTAWDTPTETDTHQQDAVSPAPGREKAQGIHLVRDPSDSALAGLYESSNVILPSDRLDDPPEPMPESRWLMYGDQALAAAQEAQRRIKAKIRPHVERYKKITGNKR